MFSHRHAQTRHDAALDEVDRLVTQLNEVTDELERIAGTAAPSVEEAKVIQFKRAR
jgi:hypothetical protein